MGKIDVLLDTDALIRSWRGDTYLDKCLDGLRAGVDPVVRLEFLQGANKRQMERAERFLKRFDAIPFQRNIEKIAEELIVKFAHSRGLRANDALIAAAAILLNVPLLSFNTRHFEFIKELKQL